MDAQQKELIEKTEKAFYEIKGENSNIYELVCGGTTKDGKLVCCFGNRYISKSHRIVKVYLKDQTLYPYMGNEI